jgi:thiamine kinase-like enzyme
MTTTVTPEAVLAGIPGWDDASVTELHGGLTNRSWHIVKDDRAGVLKIDHGFRGAPFNTRTAEARIQTAAARQGLAAQVILASDGVFFAEYVEGRVWTRDSFGESGNLELIADALRRLHALPLTGRALDARVAAKRYVEKAAGLDSGIARKCTDIVSRMRLPHNLCCCHNDLVAENIIATPDLRFLDWEYACDNDPFFDLATVVEHHELDDSQVTRLLNAYLGGDGQRWRSHLEKQRKLYLALLCLWMASRPDSDPEELARVSRRLLTSDS